ncbi:MAG: NADAR family protein [Formivibrio sp.]|nr:NADAR family protein [Formivibrio sp.]
MAGLLECLQQGDVPPYLFFWSSFANADGSISETCLSQWFAAGFEIDGVSYRTDEHYMMAEKARLFGDDVALAKVLRSRFPAEVKKFGREIVNFDEAVWCGHRFDIVVRGNLAKFRQNPALKAWLLASGDSLIVEASPADAIWGIGLAEEHPYARVPKLWPGLNLLGFALMEVRRQIAMDAV